MNIKSPGAEQLIADPIPSPAEMQLLSDREPRPSNQLEVAMNESPTLALLPYQVAWPIAPSRPAGAGRRYGLTSLLNIFRTWEDRLRFRWQLKEMARTAPHLIDDMGLTKKQVEAEIAKRFWQE